MLATLSAAFRVHAPSSAADSVCIRYAADTPYNYVDVELEPLFADAGAPKRRYPIQLRQGGSDDAMDVDANDDDNVFAVIDLERKCAADAPTWTRDMQRGWLAANALHDTFVGTRPVNAKRRQILCTLFNGLTALFRDLVATREPATQLRPHVIIMQCKRGLERSLLMLNTIAYGLSTLASAGNQEKAFQVRKRKFDATQSEKEIHNVLVLLALDHVPVFMTADLSCADRPAKRARVNKHIA